MKKRILLCGMAALLLTGCGAGGMNNAEEKELLEMLENTYHEKFTVLNSYKEAGGTENDYIRRMNVIPNAHPEYLFDASAHITKSKNSSGREIMFYYTAGIINGRAADEISEPLTTLFGKSCAVRADLHHGSEYYIEPNLSEVTYEDFLEFGRSYSKDTSNAEYDVIVNENDYSLSDAGAEYELLYRTLSEFSDKIELSGSITLRILPADAYKQYQDWFKEHLEDPPADSECANVLSMPSYTIAYNAEQHQLAEGSVTKEDYIAARTQ